MIAVWESDMLDTFDPTFFKLLGKLIHNVAPL